MQESTWYCISTDTKHTQRFQHTTQRNLLLSVIKMISGKLVLFAAICLFLWQTSRFFFWHMESLMVTDLLSTLSEFDWLYQSIKFCNLSLLFWPDLVQEKTYYMYYNFAHTNKQSVKKGQSNILNKVKKITSRLYTRINSLRLMHHAVNSKKSIFHWWFLIPHTINTSFFRF